MNLIIGTRHVTPDAITRTAEGVEAILHGEALLSLLDAVFHGAGTIEILGGDLDRHRMEVTGIAMQGGETRVMLAALGAAGGLLRDGAGCAGIRG